MPNPSPDALQHLRQDAKLASFIDDVELEEIVFSDDVYERLIRAIIYQQLSGKAAATIHGRFLALFPDEYPTPDRLLAFDVPDLRSVGLSNQKARYVQNVAEFFLEEKLLSHDWNQYADEELLQKLTSIKGVGEWTVQMILMFTLGRPDILPLGDLGIQQAMQMLYGWEDLPTRQLKKAMAEQSEAWRPHRTLVCRYLWRWKDEIANGQ